MKAISLRLDEDMLDEIREVSKIYNITATELIREGIKNILNNKKNDIYFKLISNKTEYDEKESSEIISKINNLESKSSQYESFFNIKNLTFQNPNKINKFLNRKLFSPCKPSLSDFFQCISYYIL